MTGPRVRRYVPAACLLAAAVLSLASDPAGATARSPLWTGHTERVSVGPNGDEAHGSADAATSVYYPAISANGRFVAFTSDAFGLTRPCNALQRYYLGSQVYVRDLARGTTELVSARPDGCPGGSASSSGGGISPASVSADGRYIAFVSAAENLVPGFRPTGPNTAVYLRDRITRRTVAVSIGYDGKANNAISDHPSISADGRYVAFDSGASNLVKGDPIGHGDNLVPDVFVRDMRTGRTERVGSIHPRKVRFDKTFPSISGNGRYVVFTCADPTLAGTPNYGDLLPVKHDRGEGGPSQVYVYDRTTRRTEIVSRSDDGLTGNHDSDPGPSGRTISADGRYVVFASKANNLGPPNDAPWREVQPDLTQDIYLYDRTAHHLARISVGPGGIPADYGSMWPSISGDGRSVAFHSGATNLGDADATVPVTDYLPVPTDAGYDVYVRDLTAGTNRLVSRSTDGVQGDLSSYNAVLSGDGRTVAFVSDAANLVTNDTNGQADVFAYHAS